MKNLKTFEPKNIIVRMPNWIGDLVMATPLLYDLKQAYPKATITAMCLSHLAPLLLHDPSINELFAFSKSKQITRRITERNLVEKLRKVDYDLGVLLTNSFSSAWRFWQGKVKVRIGFKNEARSLFLTHPLPFPENRKTKHLTFTYKTLLSPLGIEISKTPPQLYVLEEEKEEGWEFLRRFGVEKGKMLIGINPGAAYGSAKCWLPERFRNVAKKLTEEKPNAAILFFGDLSHKELLQKISLDLPSNVLNLAGQTTLRELTSLISLCTIFLTNDSGPMHIADAVGTPIVALFGSTDPVVTGPYRKGGAELIQKFVPCSPCFKRVCPIDFPCMKKIEEEEVVRALLAGIREKHLPMRGKKTDV